MFTGLVEAMGRVRSVRKTRAGARLEIDVPWAVRAGESIAVNGACLTVVTDSSDRAAFDAIPETLKRTGLGALRRGDRVNLERALRAGDRLGGHFVQGHVDATGTVDRIARGRSGVVLRIAVAPETARLMIEKGSIAVDGVSLTVVEAGPDFFTVALIPVTLRETTLGRVKRGARVNIELDMIGKYVDRLVGRRRGGLTRDLLSRAGFVR